VSLAESFLSLVRKVSADVDVERLKEEILAVARSRPDWTTREKAEWLVSRTAKRAAALGAVAGLPAGWGAALAAGPELSALLLLQSRLILGLHLLYGELPAAEERALEVLAGLATGAGISTGRRLTARAAEEVAERLVVRLAGREMSHVVPLLGALAGALLNYAAVRAVGRAALARVERLHGPPEVPGKGPVLDARGNVA